MVDIYLDASRLGIYPRLFTSPSGDSCFSIYQIRWIKKCRFFNGHNFFFWNFRETTRQFSLRSQNSKYPRIFQVTAVNQNARKLLSTDLVNTNSKYQALDSPKCVLDPLTVVSVVKPLSSLALGSSSSCWLRSNKFSNRRFTTFLLQRDWSCFLTCDMELLSLTKKKYFQWEASVHH